MGELKSGEIVIRQELFNLLVDQLTDALGWLLVLRDENPGALKRTCGNLDVEQRLAHMSAALSGRTLQKRYPHSEFDLVMEQEPEPEMPVVRRRAGSRAGRAAGPDTLDAKDELDDLRRSLQEPKSRDRRKTKR